MRFWPKITKIKNCVRDDILGMNESFLVSSKIVKRFIHLKFWGLKMFYHFSLLAWLFQKTRIQVKKSRKRKHLTWWVFSKAFQMTNRVWRIGTGRNTILISITEIWCAREVLLRVFISIIIIKYYWIKLGDITCVLKRLF